MMCVASCTVKRIWIKGHEGDGGKRLMILLMLRYLKNFLQLSLLPQKKKKKKTYITFSTLGH